MYLIKIKNTTYEVLNIFKSIGPELILRSFINKKTPQIACVRACVCVRLCVCKCEERSYR